MLQSKGVSKWTEKLSRKQKPQQKKIEKIYPRK